ncbi:MAG TPA: zinc carboxypeptidase [Candidatus Cloacimonetes bacterium]|nr:zinc carboxypeptidase [Candidatus Cloacimonadota bacterium]
MLKKTILLILFSIQLLLLSAENKEIYFKFFINSKKELFKLTRIISIDNVHDKTVFAYANEKEFQEFTSSGYSYEILTNPSKTHQVKMATSREQMRDWDSYPTYETYVDLMYQFQIDHPDLCSIENIGSSVEGREILFAKISDNVNIAEDEPEFMYTATMHGDELVGYILMLRLIDELLSNYGSDPQITNLVNNVEIWINPAANPDGTYAGGNNTVWGATRYNANSVDLNRNFPDPEDGDHPDGNEWQPEIIIMMDFAFEHDFVLSANLHSGAEVVNYPWDTWPQLHADDDWWQEVSHTYADKAQDNSPYGYMNGFDDGITNGYAWYTISGGRQDYMNYFHGCREMTLELSNVKLLPEDELEDHWNYNRESLLLYIEECLYGIRGIVSDENSNPTNAVIHVIDHDIDNSEVFTDAEIGDYHRMLFPGSYDLQFLSFGYLPQTVENISISDNEIIYQDVTLQPAENYTVSGTIVDGDSQIPLENVSIELSHAIFDIMYETQTDDQGFYQFENIYEGTYSIKIVLTGYTQIFEEIEVSDNMVFDYELYQSNAESFESGEFSEIWSFSGDADWFIDNSTAYDGIYSACSGDIGSWDTSSLITEMNVTEAGDISFFIKVSCEDDPDDDWDFITFRIDS